MRDEHAPLVAALALALLPFALDLAGLPLRSAIDVVVFAIACMGLNVLIGDTGLVSFGHGAWFGLGAYAAALSQRYWFPGGIILPFLFAIFFVAAAAFLSGVLILRRRGVYFSLLTLALTALLFAIAYRWTELTGGESGLGGVTRSAGLALDLQSPLRLRRAACGRLLRRACRDGGDRRHAQLSRARARRIVFHSLSRVPFDLDGTLAVLFRRLVRRLHRVLSDRPRRCRGAHHGAVPQACDRGGGNGR